MSDDSNLYDKTHLLIVTVCILLKLSVAEALTLLHKSDTCPLLEVVHNLKRQWDVCWYVHHILLH
jgi:hypothetical protein